MKADSRGGGVKARQGRLGRLGPPGALRLGLLVAASGLFVAAGARAAERPLAAAGLPADADKPRAADPQSAALGPVEGVAQVQGTGGLRACPDYVVAAPGAWSGTTCGALNDCGLRSSEEVTYQVDIPTNGKWLFSLCGSSFDTYLYLATACCGSDIGWIDDVCGQQSEFIADLGAGTYYVAIEGYGSTDCGTYGLAVSQLPACDVSCAPTSTPEGEPICTNGYVDNYNGGCNSTPNVFQAIACGETVCGTSGTYTYGSSSYRDTDWFQVVVTTAQTLTWSATAEFPVAVIVMNAGSGDCLDYTILDSDTAYPCNTASVTFSASPGSYWLWAGPSQFHQVPCGAEYEATLSCTTPIPPGDDCWSTACGGTRADFADNPIPADFFDPGSQPFDGIIELGGATGFADTIVERQGTLLLPPPYPVTETVPVELVQLNLVSCAPITVQPMGSQWDVAVDLSTTGPPLGTMTVTKESSSGGTFTAQFYVQPRYTFTRVTPPFDVLVFDTGLEGILPILMETVGEADWSTNELFEICTLDGFAAGVSTDTFGQPCCEETCHGTSGDPTPCDPSGGHCHCTKPPHCEWECPQACCLGDGSCQDVPAQQCQFMGGLAQGEDTTCEADGGVCQRDCNSNALPDLFEVAGGTAPDVNCNQVPDECEASCCDPASNRNGDWDGDCDVDLRDFSSVQICMGRTSQSGCCLADGCASMDLDGNAEVTLDDYQEFYNRMQGPNVPLPGCDPSTGACDAWATGYDPGGDFGGTYYVFGCPPPPLPSGYVCGVNDNPPIPADFFGPGSLPFEGVIVLSGQAEDFLDMGNTDTLVEHPPLRFGFGDLPVCDTVPARLNSLSLRSTNPIVVEGVEWHVAAELSVTPPADGSITACKTHANGGTFDATIYVQPLFVFVNKADLDAGAPPTSDNVKVLDTGVEGLPPITFQFFDQPFSICVPSGEGIYVTPCSQGNFVPGVDTSGGKGLRQTTCSSHITPGESHYFCPPECFEHLCTYPAVFPGPLGFCFPFGCGAPVCPLFPASLIPGAQCLGPSPAPCPAVGYFLLGFGPCATPPCAFPAGPCIQFYGPPIFCTPTGRLLCP